MALEGTQFGHYRLLTLIGKGGMGEVYLAEDTQLRRQIAAKLLRIEMAQSDQQMMSSALRLFWREATAIARFDHPSIVPLYDHGETTIEGLHVAYLIMPYRPEGSLVTWLRKRSQTQQTRQLTLQQVVHVIRQASQGLQYAHDQQVMHLDVKPANFLIRSRSEADEYPDLLLSDFGISRLTSATSSSSQQISGTPTYMAPEQCTGQPVFASDQYSLAIMAYELLTGSPPFQGPPMKVLYAHVQEQPEPVHKRNPLLPSAVGQVLQRALAKKPEERFPSVAAFAQAFQQALEGMSEKSTLRLLRPSLPPPAMSDASPVHTPVANDATLPAGNIQLPPPVPSALTVAPGQEKVTLPSSASTDSVKILAPRTPSEPEQTAIAPAGSATFTPLAPPTRPKRQISPASAVALVVLALLFIGGGAMSTLVLTGQWRVSWMIQPLTTVGKKTPTTVGKTSASPLSPGSTASSYDLWVQSHGRMFGFDAAHTGFNPYETLLNTSNVSRLKLAWTSDPIGEDYFSSPVVSAGLVYVASQSGQFYAIDSITGHVRWTTSPIADNASFSTPAVVSGIAYIGSGQKLYAFDAVTGKLRWASSTGALDSSSPIVTNGVVYIPGHGSIYAFNATTGELLWASAAIGSTSQPVAISQGIVYVGISGKGPSTGRIVALRAANGQVLWTSDLILPHGTDINSAPTVANGLVYIGAYGGIAAFDAMTGQKRWVTPDTTGSTGASPAVANGVVYISSDKVYAFNATTGVALWTSQAIGAYSGDSPEVANGILYVCSTGNSSTYALDATSGKVLWTSLSTQSQPLTTPAVANGVVYIAPPDGYLYAFHLSQS